MTLSRYGVLLTGLFAVNALTGCATTMGGATVTAQPPTDIVGKAREVARLGPPAYVFQKFENANQGDFGGCGANAIFVPNRGFSGFGRTSYIHLNAREIRELLETGATWDKGLFIPIVKRRVEQFDRGQLESALLGVQAQASMNATTRRCLGYN